MKMEGGKRKGFCQKRLALSLLAQPRVTVPRLFSTLNQRAQKTT